MNPLNHRTVSCLAHTFCNRSLRSYSVSLKLYGAISRQPAGLSNVFRRPLASTAAAGLKVQDFSQSQATLPTSAESDRSASDEAKSAKKEEAAQRSIKSLSTPKEVIQYMSHGYHSIKDISLCMEHLAQLLEGKSESEITDVKNHEVFQTKIRRIEADRFEQHPPSIVVAYQALDKLGFDLDSKVMKALEADLQWVMRRCHIRHVAQSVALLGSSTPKGESAIVKSSTSKLASNHPLVVCVDMLQRRWMEATSGSDFISVFRAISYVNDVTRSKLEDRAAENLQEFTASEIVKIFSALGAQKRRPTPLLRAMAFHFAKNAAKVSGAELAELLFACNELNFIDSLLLSKVCTDLVAEVENISNVSTISLIVKNLGQMRYLNTELMDVLESWALKNQDKLRPFDFAAWILTSAILDLKSETAVKLCTAGMAALSNNRTNPSEWISVAHSLSVLGLLQPKMLESVLSDDVVQKINAMSSRSVGARNKLLLLNAMAQQLESYKGPYLPQQIISEWTPKSVFAIDAVLSKAVYESLNNFLPAPKYLQEPKSLECGVYVDAFCFLNEKLDPIAIEAARGKQNVRKVAVVVLGFHSHTQGSRRPTGHARFNVEILKSKGYDVLTVPFTEFSPQEKLIRKVQYLEQKLRSVNMSSESTS